MPIEGLMQAILVQEHKDKIINTMVHEVLLPMDENFSTIPLTIL